jgi:AraC-like DNA-binding protein
VLIRSVVLQTYEKAARAIGIDPYRQMRLAGLACEEPIPGETFVPEALFTRLLESTAAAAACPDFGLRMALWPDEFLEGPLVLLMRHAPTLRDALALLQRYGYAYAHDFRPALVPAHDAPDCIDLVVAGREAEGASLVQATDFTVATLLRVLRHVLGRTDDDWEVLLAHSAPGTRDAWHPLLRVSCREGMPFSAVRLPAADLACALPARNDLRLKMAVSYIEAYYRPADSVADQVRRLLRQRLGLAAIVQADIAAELALHVKTLQRRLAKEGRAFPTLLDEVRREAFLDLLRRPARPGLAQIALMLGYSEQAALSRSCQRWFGCSPSEMLRRHHASASPGRLASPTATA